MTAVAGTVTTQAAAMVIRWPRRTSLRRRNPLPLLPVAFEPFDNGPPRTPVWRTPVWRTPVWRAPVWRALIPVSL